VIVKEKRASEGKKHEANKGRKAKCFASEGGSSVGIKAGSSVLREVRKCGEVDEKLTSSPNAY